MGSTEELGGGGGGEGGFDQNILYTCMKFSVKQERECDLKGNPSFSKGNIVSCRTAAHRSWRKLKLGVVTGACKDSAQMASPSRALHQNSVLKVGGGM